MTQQVPQPPRLAGYSYVRVLGHGSTATVYLYRQQGIERDVAVKVSVEQVDGRIADAFRAEARAMAALPSHPSILSTYDAGVTDDGRYYLVFEYAPGGTLKDVLCDHVLDVPHMLSMGVHLAGAVATAHRAGIVHRDIKTSNVLITGQQLPALADFGIAVTAYDHSSTGYSLPGHPGDAAHGRCGRRGGRHLFAGRSALCLTGGHLPVRIRVPPEDGEGVGQTHHDAAAADDPAQRRSHCGV